MQALPISTGDLRPIPGFAGYLIGADGSCWATGHKKRQLGTKRSPNWRLLTLVPDHDLGQRVTKRVCEWVALAFLGSCPDGHALCAPVGSESLASISYQPLHPTRWLPDDVAAWKQIPICPAYWASDDGRIWSSLSQKLRQPVHNPTSGYLGLPTTRPNGRKISSSVHVLVASAFLGDRPMGYVIDHIDGDRLNNRASNLRYVTNSENIRAAHRQGGGKRNRPVQVLVDLGVLRRELEATGLKSKVILTAITRARSSANKAHIPRTASATLASDGVAAAG